MKGILRARRRESLNREMRDEAPFGMSLGHRCLCTCFLMCAAEKAYGRMLLALASRYYSPLYD